MKNRTLLLAIASVFAMTPLMASATVSAKAEIQAISKTDQSVTPDEVIQYMAGFGIRVVQVGPIPGTTNYGCIDDKGIRYIVYVQDSAIIGYDEQNGM